MKRLVIMISILALAFTACSTDNNDDNGGKLTISGLPQSEGGYSVDVFTSGTDISTYQAYNAAYNNFEATSGVWSGNVFPLAGYTSPGVFYEKWTKSGNFPVLLLIVHDNTSNTAQRFYATVNFSNGKGTTQFSSFTLQQ